jgi:tRNA(Ile)-lysidine synthetase-like protein
VELGGGWRAEAVFDRLVITRSAESRVADVVATAEQGSAAFGAFLVRWAPDDAPTLLERAAWTTWIAQPGWEVRRARAGDRVAPLGGTGHRPLRRVLMEARVPRSARGAYPVVARGETILWVPGICRSGAELPAPGTRAVRLDVIQHGDPAADRRA